MPLEPQAQALYDILEAIFDYVDTYLEPRGIGLFTTEKAKIMIQKADMFPELAGLHPSEPLALIHSNIYFVDMTVYSAIPVSLLAAQYKVMECPIHLLPPYVPSDSPYHYRDADQPALTKAGWIKSETIGLLTGSENQTDVRTSSIPDFSNIPASVHSINLTSQTSYRLMQGVIANCDLQIKNPVERARFPGGRYLPLPEKSTVEWYARSLAPALGIHQIDGIAQRMQAGLIQSQGQGGGMSEQQFSMQKNALLEQERQNQLSNMRTRMADAALRRSEESKLLRIPVAKSLKSY